MQNPSADRMPAGQPATEVRLPSAEALSAAPGVARRCAALSAVPSTLRIPLAARAWGERLFPQVAVGDVHAAATLAALGDDGRQWLSDLHSVYGCLARTRRFRELARHFLALYPDGHIVNLGCGLSHYFQWLDNDRVRMTDADLPEVLAIRRELLPVRCDRYELRELDLTAPDWWSSLGLPVRHDAPPLFLFCEGVLMYLPPEAVHGVLRTFGECAPAGSLFAFDAMCWLAVGCAQQNLSVRHTKAEFLWGVRRPMELQQLHPRLRLRATHPVMEGYGLPYSVVGPLFRAFMGVHLYAIYVLQTVDDEAEGIAA